MNRIHRLPRLAIELAVLLAFCWLGSSIAAWLGWPIPGGVIGMGLLLLLFASKRLTPASLQLGSGLLLAEMLLFCIPPLMSVLDHRALLQDKGWQLGLMIAISTLLVALSTGLTVEILCRRSMQHES
ncbi:CidA/LrgA family protein [Janthinobacterium sp. 17J80-10]|uniref:CidA/LrgA family protein n=1 Tax=Janthinobacterium sp. 17J80-10 TaxID=2497863 RepID=UPI001005480A|nr:CidA/LrgA family protein [Janthinobacterium sp. 17J80-10]QAU32904.1 CidA/LrgA family protein [Janthinobacterium sp. 17J80-10]